jgi:hypothetical protein
MRIADAEIYVSQRCQPGAVCMRRHRSSGSGRFDFTRNLPRAEEFPAIFGCLRCAQKRDLYAVTEWIAPKIRPFLHHFATLWQVGGAIVWPSRTPDMLPARRRARRRSYFLPYFQGFDALTCSKRGPYAIFKAHNRDPTKKKGPHVCR